MEPLLTKMQTLANAATKSTIQLRLRAAAALATSLAPTEKQKLYDAIGAVDSHTAEKETNKSVGEAVAAALALEYEKGRTKLEHAVTLAERAAEERIKAEMKLLTSSSEMEKEEGTEVEHALLGTQVVDLGYKRVYISKARDLAAIPIWEKQRAYRHDRAKEMAKEKLKNKHVGLPGVIALHEDDNGKLSIIDGQHRVGMMALLLQKKTFSTSTSTSVKEIGFDLDQILVEVFPNNNDANTSSFARDVFLDINKAEPIKLVDMPGVATAKERNVITTAVDKLQEKYADMFKTSQRCRAPHLNADNLRDALFSSGVLKRHEIGSDAGALVDWMERKNGEIRERLLDDGAPPGISKRVLEKAKKFDFFLGLESAWLYQ